MDLGLQGKRAIVCASSQGLGLACATSLVREGCDVFINGRDVGKLATAADGIRQATGRDVHTVGADINTDDGRAALLAACPDADILINNNAGPAPGKLEDWDRAAWMQAIEANMLAPIFLIRALVPGMRQRRFGRIVNITSAMVKSPSPAMGLSTACRVALVALSKSVQREAVADNVTINNLLPERFDTDRQRFMAERMMKQRGISNAQAYASIVETIAAGRLGTPKEFGDTCAFICSVQSSFMSGQNIQLDGGSYKGVDVISVVQLDHPGGPDVLQVVRKPRPEPKSGQARVVAHAIGVGKPDMMIRLGIYKWMPALPATPGNELAGVVDAVGPGVQSLAIGGSVLVSARELSARGGCYAECVCVPAEALYVLPTGVSMVDAVSAPNYQMGAAMLFDAGGAPPASVLVHGAAGGVATAVLQLAHSYGIVGIGTTSTKAKQDAVRALGIEHVIDRSLGDLREQVMRITEGRGVDLVLDHVGGTGFVDNLDLLAARGTLLSFNVLSGVPQENLIDALRGRLDRSLAVRCYSIHTLDADRDRRRSLMEMVLVLMGQGAFRPPPPVLFAFNEVRAAHEALDAGQTPGKIVLLPGCGE